MIVLPVRTVQRILFLILFLLFKVALRLSFAQLGYFWP